MAAPQPAVPAPRNRLLAPLPAEDPARIWPQLERLEFEQRHILPAPDEPITAVYFPETGCGASMLAVLADGRSAEVGIVGSEGMVGLPLLLGSDSSAVESMI